MTNACWCVPEIQLTATVTSSTYSNVNMRRVASLYDEVSSAMPNVRRLDNVGIFPCDHLSPGQHCSLYHLVKGLQSGIER